MKHDAGHELLRRPLHRPNRSARFRIEAAHALAAREDHLRLAGDFDEHRRAVGSQAIRAIHAPLLFPRPLVEGDEVRLALLLRILVAVDDEQILVEHRRTAEAVDGVELAGGGVPELLAGEVVAEDTEVAAFGERDVDAFAVRDGRARREAVELVFPFERGRQALLGPELLPGRAVVAEEHPRLRRLVIAVVFEAAREEDFARDDHGRGVTDTWDRPLPLHAFFQRPLRRILGFVGGAVAARAAPAGPVFGECGTGGEDEEQASEAQHRDGSGKGDSAGGLFDHAEAIRGTEIPGSASEREFGERC